MPNQRLVEKTHTAAPGEMPPGADARAGAGVPREPPHAEDREARDGHPLEAE